MFLKTMLLCCMFLSTSSVFSKDKNTSLHKEKEYFQINDLFQEENSLFLKIKEDYFLALQKIYEDEKGYYYCKSNGNSNSKVYAYIRCPNCKYYPVHIYKPYGVRCPKCDYPIN